MPIDLKQWYRTNLAPYLTIIKSWTNTQITNAVEAAKTVLRAEMAEISPIGLLRGESATFAGLPTGTSIKNGDWAILTVDDIGTGTFANPQYDAGMYVKGAGGWVFSGAKFVGANELQTILATQPEFEGGTSTTKATSVAQVFGLFNGIATTYAAIAGKNSQLFSVAGGNAGTDEAVNANQFGTAVTVGEATTDFAAA